MKVLLINGSPRQGEKGCTSFCLNYLAEQFKNDNVETEIFNIPQTIAHCNNCRQCKAEHLPCLKDRTIERAIKKIIECDGIIIGSPVYYYSITSQLQAFLTRLCYSYPKAFNHKLCSFFSVSRRSGNTDAFNQVVKIFQMHNAIIPGGTYVNEIYGDNPNELQYDKEGLLSLKAIEDNFIALMPLIKDANFREEKKIHTNFISREFLSYVEKEHNKKQTIDMIYGAY